MKVSAGQIKPRTPRPLTAAERKKVRQKNGGHASAEDLQRLADAFAKPERTQQGGLAVSRSNNGWTS